LLRSEDRGPKLDAVLLNAGAALFLAGCAKSFGAGWSLAEELLGNGAGVVKLAELTRR
jgi:anthranilate phosphoribosyltransferase